MTTAAHLTARDAAVGQDTAEHAALKVRSDFRQIRSLKGQCHKNKKVFDQDCAHILGILMMNSYNTDIFFSNYYNLQSVHFELQSVLLIPNYALEKLLRKTNCRAEREIVVVRFRTSN